MSAPTCPNCRQSMEEGFLLDRGHANAAGTTEWIEGAPEKSFWTGTKLRGKMRMKAQAYRCTKCGLLQMYARG
jgi:hypothetical protein